MSTKASLSVLIAISLFLAAPGMTLSLQAQAEKTWKPGFYPLLDDHGMLDPAAKLAAEIRTADCEITIDYYTKVDLGIGRYSKKDGSRISQLFALDELEWYFAIRRRTGFIVVNGFGGKDAEARASLLKGYFVRLGYKHILFLSPDAFGYRVYEDFRPSSR